MPSSGPALNLAAAAVGQTLTAQLLAAITPGWLAAHRRALAQRRDHLTTLLAARLPAWRADSPAAGLSLWAELPLDSADAFAHVAARHGVTVAAGSTCCLDRRHHHYLRLSFAEQPGTLELAVERLAAAWETHTQNLAATPPAPASLRSASRRVDGPHRAGVRVRRTQPVLRP